MLIRKLCSYSVRVFLDSGNTMYSFILKLVSNQLVWKFVGYWKKNYWTRKKFSSYVCETVYFILWISNSLAIWIFIAIIIFARKKEWNPSQKQLLFFFPFNFGFFFRRQNAQLFLFYWQFHTESTKTHFLKNLVFNLPSTEYGYGWGPNIFDGSVSY